MEDDAISSASSSSATVSNPGEGLWEIPPGTKEKYIAKFERLDIGGIGFLTGLVSMEFMLKSGLPNETLHDVWELSDINKDGDLDLEEFCVCCHLIMQVKVNGRALPATLPDELNPAIVSRREYNVIQQASEYSVDYSDGGSAVSSVAEDSFDESNQGSGMQGGESSSESSVRVEKAQVSVDAGSSVNTTTLVAGEPSKVNVKDEEVAQLGVGSVLGGGEDGFSERYDELDEDLSEDASSATASLAGGRVSPALSSVSSSVMSNSIVSGGAGSESNYSQHIEEVDEIENDVDPSVDDAGAQGESSWEIGEEMIQKYAAHFHRLDRDRRGFLTGLECMEFMVKSNLPDAVLHAIWELSDIDQDGDLNVKEFCICFHLIMQVASAGRALPKALPAELLHATIDPIVVDAKPRRATQGVKIASTGDLRKQVLLLEKQIKTRRMHRRQLEKSVTDFEKKNQLLDGKCKAIKSNFNRIHELTLKFKVAEEKSIKERKAVEREVQNVRQKIANNRDDIVHHRTVKKEAQEKYAVISERVKRLNRLVGEMRRKLQHLKREENRTKQNINRLNTQERTANVRLDMVVAENAHAVMKIEHLLMDIQMLSKEPVVKHL